MTSSMFAQAFLRTGSQSSIFYVGPHTHARSHARTLHSPLPPVMDRMMNTNFFGAIYCTHYAFPYLQASKGMLGVVSSVAGGISPPYLTFYAAAKHAVHGFFEALRNEEPGFAVCILCPGYVATEIDDNKMVGDGSVRAVDLNVDKAKYMSVEKAAKLMVDALQKRKKLFHLTTAGSMGVTLRSLFPGTVDSAVRKEMKTITDEEKIRKRKEQEERRRQRDDA
jgi:short-subunit dehydrogenase